MIKYFIGIILLGCLTSCEEIDYRTANIVNKDTVDLLNYYTIHPAKLNGHDYILYESGYRYSEHYSFSIEHKIDCKKCLDKFE